MMKPFTPLLLTILFCCSAQAKIITQPKERIIDDATSFAEIVCGDVRSKGKHKYVRYQFERAQFPDVFLDNLEREFGSHFENLERHNNSIVVVNQSLRGKVSEPDLTQCKSDVLLFTLQNVL